MSSYWDFYYKALAYPEIQKPGPLALLAEADAKEYDSLYNSALAVRKQFFPTLAEDEAVAMHAQGRGVHRYKNEDLKRFRLRVINAFAWQKLSGRHWGMHKIFSEYGFPIVSLVPLKGSHWAEFDLIVRAPDSLGEDVWELLFWMAGTEYKRATARLRSLRLQKQSEAVIIIKAAALCGEKITLFPPGVKQVMPKIEVYAAGASISHERWCLGGKYE